MARKKQEIALQKEINTQEEWDDFMTKEGLFIIDIYQEWCGPCKSIVSLFRRLKNESGEDALQFAVAKADNIDSLMRYRGTCKPCFLFYGSGTLVEVVRGVDPPTLEKCIKRHLEIELKALKGEPGVERVEIKDPAFKGIDEAERLAKEKDDEDEEEEEIEREVTVVLIKPDAKEKVEEIKQKLEERGIEILEQQERKLTEEEARDFYRHLEDQEWFDQMVAYMTSDESTVLVIAKENQGIISEFREILGPAIVEEAKEKEPESLRAIFGSESFKNAIHAADSGEKAQKELQFFFPEFRIPTYKVRKPKKQKKSQIEKTVALVRPDAFAEFKEEILAKIKEAGFAIALKKEVQLTREQAEEFYSDKKESPFFEELINRMTNGPVLALALAKEDAIKEWRESLGEKDPKAAKNSNPQSLRAIYSKEDIEINLLHGSDSLESARKEMEFFFPTEQTVVVVKPDAYESREEIVQRLTEADFTIALRRDLTFTDEMARELYKRQAEKEFFEELVAHMTSGTSVVLVASRPDAVVSFRALMGDSDPAKATDAPDADGHTIRADFGKDLVHNAVHGSSDAQHAKETISLIFGDAEFDEEGLHKSGTGNVLPEDTQPVRGDDEFRGPNDEVVKNDAEEAQPLAGESDEPEESKEGAADEAERSAAEDEKPAAEDEKVEDKDEKAEDKDKKAEDKDEKAEDKDEKAEDKDKKAEEKDEKAEDKDEKAEDKDEKPADKDAKPEDKDEKPEDKDEKAEDKDEKPEDKDEKPEDKDEKPEDKDEKADDKDDKQKAEGEKSADEGEKSDGEKAPEGAEGGKADDDKKSEGAEAKTDDSAEGGAAAAAT